MSISQQFNLADGSKHCFREISTITPNAVQIHQNVMTDMKVSFISNSWQI